MGTTDQYTQARLAQLERQLGDIETTMRSLKTRKNVDSVARDQYYRLRGVWARKKALLAELNR